jgi:hypothetical protein
MKRKELYGVSLQPNGQAMSPEPRIPQIILEGKPTPDYEKAYKLARKKVLYLRERSPGDENLLPEDLLVRLKPEENTYFILQGARRLKPFRP